MAKKYYDNRKTAAKAFLSELIANSWEHVIDLKLCKSRHYHEYRVVEDWYDDWGDGGYKGMTEPYLREIIDALTNTRPTILEILKEIIIQYDLQFPII